MISSKLFLSALTSRILSFKSKKLAFFKLVKMLMMYKLEKSSETQNTVASTSCAMTILIQELK